MTLFSRFAVSSKEFPALILGIHITFWQLPETGKALNRKILGE
jgi:hypothetical protein